MNATVGRILESRAAQPLRPLLYLLAYYPLLLVVPAVLLMFAWGMLMGDYDAFHQLWSENPLAGFLAGVCAATVLGQVVLAVYLFDEDRGNPGAAAARHFAPTPRWGYWAAWGLLLLAAVAPMAVLSEQFAAPGEAQVKAEAARFWFPLGVSAAVIAFGILRLAAPGWFEFPERVGYGVTLLIVGGFVLMTAAHAAFPGMYCPWMPAAVSLLLLLGFVTALFALFTHHARRHTPLLYPGLLGVFVVPFLIPACQTEYRLPNMELAGGDGKTYYDEPFRLAAYPAARTSERGKEAGLLDDDAALRAWHDRMVEKYGEPQPVVVVTVSGGASASALYCADVLFTLEEQFPGFADRVRLVSGASGGMLGAAYFVTQLRPGGLIAEARGRDEYREYLRAGQDAEARPGDRAARGRVFTAERAYQALMARVREDFFRGLEQDFLGPLVQKWVHQDMPLGALPRSSTNDRGLALELAWKRHLRGALDVPFRDLRPEEEAGRLPSLVFTPMMVEDGRQLIVSNLSLDYMVETARDKDRPMSFMGVEFYRMFPKADAFRLSTAARMSASFPYFSPSAALPTDPVRHVVDAGYYDNYGTTVATKWLTQHIKMLSGGLANGGPENQKIPEVILLQIRCFGYERSRLQIVTERELRAYSGRTGRPADPPGPLLEHWGQTPSGRPVATQGGLFTLSAPLFGLFSSWRANMLYRADERLGGAMARLRPRPKEGRPGVELSAYPIECQVNPSLNWVLTAGEVEAIHADVRANLRSADIPTEVRQRVDQARPAARPGEAPTAADVARMDPALNNAEAATRGTVEAQAQVADKMGALKFPSPPQGRPHPPKK